MMNRRAWLAAAAASTLNAQNKKLLLPSDQPDEHHFRLMWYNPVPPINQTTWRLKIGGWWKSRFSFPLPNFESYLTYRKAPA